MARKRRNMFPGEGDRIWAEASSATYFSAANQLATMFEIERERSGKPKDVFRGTADRALRESARWYYREGIKRGLQAANELLRNGHLEANGSGLSTGKGRVSVRFHRRDLPAGAKRKPRFRFSPSELDFDSSPHD